MRPQGSVVFSLQSSLTPGMDTDPGLTLLLWTVWEEWHHLNKQDSVQSCTGGRIRQDDVCLLFPCWRALLGKTTLLSTMSILILITRGAILWAKFKTIKKGKINQTGKTQIQNHRMTHKGKHTHTQLCWPINMNWASSNQPAQAARSSDLSKCFTTNDFWTFKR